MSYPPRTLSIAPMMAYTDRHFRMLIRLMTRYTWLYTEMVTAPAIIHGDRDKLLGYHNDEHPLALQIGGSDPDQLAQCARIAAERGYAEINLNVGCPSDRVQNGHFGACLMREPARVAACVEAMQQACSLPVTVKTRLGVDELDCYHYFHGFIEQLIASGCRTFIIHARKAWLSGLSPAQNRDVPPLRYEWVYRLKRDFPASEIIINGGIRTLEEFDAHLLQVDGVMIGRAAYATPYLFADVDQRFFASTRPVPTQAEVVRRYMHYGQQQLEQGVALRRLIAPLLGFFQRQPGARRWRRYLTEQASDNRLGIKVIEGALQQVAA